MKILVLGSSGYVGKHLVHKLQVDEHEVFGIDLHYFNHKKPLDNFHFGNLDVSNTSSLLKFIENTKVQIIINLAARKSVAESFMVPNDYAEVNAHAVSRLISKLPGTQVKKFLQASTAAVYGLQNFVSVSEDVKPNPLSPYAKTKLEAEDVIEEFSTRSEIDFYILRLFNVLGSQGRTYQDGSQDNLIPSILRRHRDMQPALIFGNEFDTADGTAIRDYIHILDVVTAIRSTIALDTQTSNCEILNIGSGGGRSVLEILNGLSVCLNEIIPYKFESARPGDIPAIVADITKARSLIDFYPRFSFQEMLNSSV